MNLLKVFIPIYNQHHIIMVRDMTRLVVYCIAIFLYRISIYPEQEHTMVKAVFQFFWILIKTFKPPQLNVRWCNANSKHIYINIIEYYFPAKHIKFLWHLISLAVIKFIYLFVFSTYKYKFIGQIIYYNLINKNYFQLKLLSICQRVFHLFIYLIFIRCKMTFTDNVYK